MILPSLRYALFFTLLTACSTSPSGPRSSESPDSCRKIRAAFDLGSSTFKMKVSRVDTCQQTLLTTLESGSEKLGFKDAMGRDHKISAEAIERGKAVVQSFLERAQKAGATEFYAVGTEIFRNAKNGQDFLSSLPSPIQVRLIEQKDEGILGYASATSVLKDGDAQVAVWDIGGGSMQITSRDAQGKFHVIQGKFASIAARDLSNQVKGTSKAKSPNPIGEAVATRTVQKIRQRAVKDIPSFMFPRVVGIGGVHAQSVMRQISETLKAPTDLYTIEQLHKTIAVQSKKTDAEIGGKYADTDVSNLLLVAGFMEALKIESVEVVDANLADGLLVSGFSFLDSARDR